MSRNKNLVKEKPDFDKHVNRILQINYEGVKSNLHTAISNMGKAKDPYDKQDMRKIVSLAKEAKDELKRLDIFKAREAIRQRQYELSQPYNGGTFNKTLHSGGFSEKGRFSGLDLDSMYW